MVTQLKPQVSPVQALEEEFIEKVEKNVKTINSLYPQMDEEKIAQWNCRMNMTRDSKQVFDFLLTKQLPFGLAVRVIATWLAAKDLSQTKVKGIQIREYTGASQVDESMFE